MSSENRTYNWILGVIVFFLCTNSAYALIELIIGNQPAGINILYIFGGTLYVPTLEYFLISLLPAAITFGYLLSRISKNKPNYDELVARVDERLERTRVRLSKEITEKFAKLSLNDYERTARLENLQVLIEENSKAMEKIADTRYDHVDVMKSQTNEIEKVKKKIEKMEHELILKPYLSSSSDVRKINGVGEKTAEQFRSAGIEKVQDIIIQPSSVLAQKTGLSENRIDKVKATTQLLMVPGIKEKNVRVLQKAGATSVSKLASQSPIALFKRITAIKDSGDKPTLDEVASYIAFARRNLSLYGD